MTRFLVLLAMALALAIVMVVRDIRRIRRAREAKRAERTRLTLTLPRDILDFALQDAARRPKIAFRRWERELFELPCGIVHYDLDMHYFGHSPQGDGLPNGYEPLSA